MAKFVCAEVYTPDDQKQPRKLDEVEFNCESKDLFAIAQAAIIAHGGSAEFFEQYAGEIKDALVSQEWYDTPENNGFDFTFRSNNGEFFYEIQQLPPSSETPITDENIVAWAENRVALSPTYNDQVEKDGVKKNVTLTNTAERELGLLLFRHSMESFKEYSKSDLLDFVVDVLRSGTKGYKDMTMPELLEEFKDVVVQPAIDNANGGTVYMEDLTLDYQD